MNSGHLFLLTASLLVSGSSAPWKDKNYVTVPVVFDHNRMIIEGEIQRKDGNWRKARLWVDSGNPDFIMSEALAKDLGMDLGARQGDAVSIELSASPGIRIASMPLDFKGVKSKVIFEPRWIFSTMHIDANLPSRALMHYQVVFDYPGKQLTLAAPGTLKPDGMRIPSSVNYQTGIVQVGSVIAGDTLSLAIDNGASYSFISESRQKKYSGANAGWPLCTGAAGCANIWGWWPMENSWTVVRVPEITLGPVRLENTGIVGLPDIFSGGAGLEEWYSLKTAKPVAGFLGPNAFRDFRIEIDYEKNEVYFKNTGNSDPHDMDIVGLTLRLNDDGSYEVAGIVMKNGKPVTSGIEPGDLLLQVDGFKTSGETMGPVIDALRGKPGDEHLLTLERNRVKIQVKTRVERIL